MFNHQIGQSNAVYQYDIFSALRVFYSIIRKTCGSDKQTMCRSIRQCTIKFLQFRTADYRIQIPSFCLNVDFIKSQFILTDYSVNTAVMRLMIDFTEFQFRHAITHLFQQMRYHPLEESRCLLHDGAQEFVRQLRI